MLSVLVLHFSSYFSLVDGYGFLRGPVLDVRSFTFPMDQLVDMAVNVTNNQYIFLTIHNSADNIILAGPVQRSLRVDYLALRKIEEITPQFSSSWFALMSDDCLFRVGDLSNNYFLVPFFGKCDKYVGHPIVSIPGDSYSLIAS